MVIVHADATGRASKNGAISQKRADAVQELLVEAGIPPRRITALGEGDRMPILNILRVPALEFPDASAEALRPRPGLRRYRPTIASTSALRKRSTTSMKPIDGMSSSSAVIEAI